MNDQMRQYIVMAVIAVVVLMMTRSNPSPASVTPPPVEAPRLLERIQTLTQIVSALNSRFGEQQEAMAEMGQRLDAMPNAKAEAQLSFEEDVDPALIDGGHGPPVLTTRPIPSTQSSRPRGRSGWFGKRLGRPNPRK